MNGDRGPRGCAFETVFERCSEKAYMRRWMRRDRVRELQELVRGLMEHKQRVQESVAPREWTLDELFDLRLRPTHAEPANLQAIRIDAPEMEWDY